MKILHVTPSYKPAYVYGGPIESVAKLCEGLIRAGNEVAVYTTTANGDTELPVKPNETVNVDGVPVTYFKRITKGHTHVSPALWKALYKNCRHYDIVHIQSWWNILVIVAAVICHRRKVKVVISPRGMLSDYILTATNSKAKQIIHSVAGRKALRQSYFHATSRIEYNECKNIIPGWQGFLVPNILTLPSIAVQKERNELFTMLFMSRIHPKKGIEFLLDALPSLDNLLLKIAGDGDSLYIEQLKEKVKALRIEHKVQWLGWKNRTEKFEELMKADLFVLMSYNENFANVVIESLHVGTPVLVSDKVGLASFVEEENMGWISGLDGKAIVQTISDIMKEKEKRNWIQQHSQALIDTLFSEQKLIRQYQENYNTVAAGKLM